ncbi:MAG: DUF4339 domain-containing protein [Bacteroidetes bacterium]|nr:MAG: DUF4339 domain-containing protein [Bacteroidota bacterium]
MQKFYIFKDDQQQGPFSTLELLELKIMRDTLVWYEGEDNWRPASEIDDLKEIFKSIPPPIQKNTQIVQPPSADSKVQEVLKATGPQKKNSSKKPLIIASVLIVLLVMGCSIYVYINHKTEQAEIERQIQDQRRVLEMQEEKIKEQQDIESARMEKEQKQKRAADAAKREEDLAMLNYEYDQAVTNLRAAKIELEEIQGIVLLRSKSEKKQQIQAQLEVIATWESEVKRLKNEIDKY